MVSLLADGLVAAGHDVTLFASGDSRTSARLASIYERAPSERIGQAATELNHALSCLTSADEFDVVSDHSGLVAAALAGTVTVPVVHTVHCPLDEEIAPIYEQIVRVAPELGLISLSFNQRRARPDLPWVASCPNAIDLDAYSLGGGRRDHLLFLGRMSPDKGCHHAIEVARAARLPLKIAAKRQEPKEFEYFESCIEPWLGDRIEYVGEVGHDEKVELLQGARALLFPIEWDEPFGLVMLEAMACGTPVVATRRGAVPEVVEHGRSGIIVDDHRSMPDVLEQAARLDPHQCRAVVEERFAPQRMVESYVAAFEDVLARAGAARPSSLRPAAENLRRGPASSAVDTRTTATSRVTATVG